MTRALQSHISARSKIVTLPKSPSLSWQRSASNRFYVNCSQQVPQREREQSCWNNSHLLQTTFVSHNLAASIFNIKDGQLLYCFTLPTMLQELYFVTQKWLPQEWPDSITKSLQTSTKGFTVREPMCSDIQLYTNQNPRERCKIATLGAIFAREKWGSKGNNT